MNTASAPIGPTSTQTVSITVSAGVLLSAASRAPMSSSTWDCSSGPRSRRRYPSAGGSVAHNGVEYGQKDAEFPRFSRLPTMVDAELELAVAGEDAPRDELRESGWHVSDPHYATASYDRFLSYIDDSTAEFAICKQVFVA